MNEKWFIIGTDERLKIVAKKLSDETRTIFYKCINEWNDTVTEQVKHFQPTHFFLPIQPIRMNEVELPIFKHAKWFVGKLTDEWGTYLKGENVFHYLKDEPFIWKNAELTAYGILTYLLEQQILLKNKAVVITGFGRVAKMTAKLLAAHDAHIIIAARSTVQLAEAYAFGYEAIPLHPANQVKAHVLINTIPAKWLDDQFTLYKTLKILDVASAPGCCTELEEVADYRFLQALPARYFPKQAAHLLYEAIIDLNKGGE